MTCRYLNIKFIQLIYYDSQIWVQEQDIAPFLPRKQKALDESCEFVIFKKICQY